MKYSLPARVVRVLAHAVACACMLIVCTAGPALSKPLRLLVVGDSLTAGYGLPADHAFPHLLESALREKGHDVRVINAGVSGDTTAGGLARIDWLLSDQPDGVIVELGANDALRGLDPSKTKSNLLALIRKIQDKSMPVLLAGMAAPPNMGTEYELEFNGVFPAVANATGILYMPFFLQDVAGNMELNQKDGIHPNKAGAAVVTDNALPYAEELIDAIEKKRAK